MPIKTYVGAFLGESCPGQLLLVDGGREIAITPFFGGQEILYNIWQPILKNWEIWEHSSFFKYLFNF